MNDVLFKTDLASYKGQYHGRSMGDIMIFGQNSLNLNFKHCVNKFPSRSINIVQPAISSALQQ